MSSMSERSERINKEFDDFFDDFESLLKNMDVQTELAERRVNASLAMLLVDGLRAYLSGDKEKAIEDISTASEEIIQRYKQSAKGDAE